MNQSNQQTSFTNQITNHLTIDVEDYFQVSAFEDIISPDDWESFESRVENNTQTILKILDSNNIKATFFIVGWIAEKNINLVKEIAQKRPPDRMPQLPAQKRQQSWKKLPASR